MEIIWPCWTSITHSNRVSTTLSSYKTFSNPFLWQVTKTLIGVMRTLLITVHWNPRIMSDNSSPVSWTDSIWNEQVQTSPHANITSTSERHLSKDFLCRFVINSHLTVLRINWHFNIQIGCSFGTNRTLPDDKGQPNCPTTSFQLSRSQAWLGHLQWVCAYHQKLHSYRNWCQT